MVQSYILAVSASCSVALGLKSIVPRLRRLSPGTKTVLTRLVPFAAVASAGALNVFLMRGEEIRRGIDVYPALGEEEKAAREKDGRGVPSLGKSRKAATMAVGETALSRVLNSTPIMVLPPLILVRLQQARWLRTRPRWVLPVNLGTQKKAKRLPPFPVWERTKTVRDRIDFDDVDLCAAAGVGGISSTTSRAGEGIGRRVLDEGR